MVISKLTANMRMYRYKRVQGIVRKYFGPKMKL